MEMSGGGEVTCGVGVCFRDYIISTPALIPAAHHVLLTGMPARAKMSAKGDNLPTSAVSASRVRWCSLVMMQASTWTLLGECLLEQTKLKFQQCIVAHSWRILSTDKNMLP